MFLLLLTADGAYRADSTTPRPIKHLPAHTHQQYGLILLVIWDVFLNALLHPTLDVNIVPERET